MSAPGGDSAGSVSAAPTTTTTISKSLASRLFFQPVHDRNVHCVRLLIETVLPVAYGDAFFRALPSSPPELAACAFFDDLFVGAIAARVDDGAGAAAPPEAAAATAVIVAAAAAATAAPPPPTRRLYLMVLGVLAPYRGRGIGASRLSRQRLVRDRHASSSAPTAVSPVSCPCLPPAGSALLQRVLDAVADPGGKFADVSEVWLHVHAPNARAASFYERAGFERTGEAKGYYRGVEPPDAFIYKRAIVRAPTC